MDDVLAHFSGTAVPVEGSCETLDVRELPPPRPLKETLERLAAMEGSSVLVQVNDREPQHLYPRLEDRGYEHQTVDGKDAVLTAIWPE